MSEIVVEKFDDNVLCPYLGHIFGHPAEKL